MTLLAWAALCVAMLALVLSIIALARGRSYNPDDWIDASWRARGRYTQQMTDEIDKALKAPVPTAPQAPGAEVTSMELLERVKRACAPGLTDLQRALPIDELKGRSARLECVVDEVGSGMSDPSTAVLHAHLVGTPLKFSHDLENGKPSREWQFRVQAETKIPKEKAARLRRTDVVTLSGRIDRVIGPTFSVDGVLTIILNWPDWPL
ncbi:MAG: hypothetical protein FJ291_00545 [Planctomycetes bacterium]|nr:hypothetical protein [Planctomycetota bacterium]